MASLSELLVEWEIRREQGESPTPSSLCPDDAALRAELAEQIRALEHFPNGPTRLPSPPPAGDPPTPERIGKYDVVRLLESGGMGVVYLARDENLGRDVAVKMIRPGRLRASAAVKRFVFEGKVLARLMHPNIVAVYDSGEHDGCPYLVMEYVPGGDLDKERERVTRGGPRAVAALVEKVARAVACAHAHDPQILHRDLKPANVLLTDGGEPKVADFGLAKLFRAAPPPADVIAPSVETLEASGATTAGGLGGGGTKGYMAPEQAGEPLTPATDVWALGVILHELLTGVKPTHGVTPNPAAVAKAVRGALGRRLAAVAGRCLQRVPAERYATAGELADALADARRTRWLWPMLLVAAALGGGGLWLGTFDWAEWRYGRSQTALARQFERGEPVQVVGLGVHGRPAYKTRVGEKTTTVQRTPDGLQVEGGPDCSLVELLCLKPNVPATIRAVVRVDRVMSHNNHCGVYFNHHTAQFNGRAVQQFELASFTDHADRLGPTAFALQQLLYAPADDERNLPLVSCAWASLKPPNVDLPGSPDTRELVVTLRPETAAHAGPVGRPAATLGPLTREHRARFRTGVAAKLGQPFAPPPDAPLRIGLSARNCRATILQFSVAPEPRTSE